MFSLKVLDDQTEKVLRAAIASNATKGFYLAGGTGLQLHLNQRFSFDLDFFAEEPFNPEKILPKLKPLSKFQAQQVQADTILATANSTKVSFFHYPYPLVRKPVSLEGIVIASLEDIAAMKLWAIASRGTKRDFFDIYFIAQKIPLARILSLYEEKYKNLASNRPHLLRSLTYFANAEGDPNPTVLDKEVTWEMVKRFFEEEAPKLLRIE